MYTQVRIHGLLDVSVDESILQWHCSVSSYTDSSGTYLATFEHHVTVWNTYTLEAH